MYETNYADCNVDLICDEDDTLNIRLRLYRIKNSDNWSILNQGDRIELNLLRYATEFEILLSKIIRSHTKIVLDDEDLYVDDIEPEEKPEWTLE